MLSDLAKRCIELSFRHRLTHVSSVLNCVDLINDIYEQDRKEDEPFVLGAGHASLAHYVVLESLGQCNAEDMIKRHGTHSSRDMEHGIWCSNGSLGQAETVACGFALADLARKVWLVTSDGACMEGSVWEAARFSCRRLKNLNAYIVHNGFGAYGKISAQELPTEFGWELHWVNTDSWPEWLRGLNGHYLTLDQEKYEELMAL